jgi:hypothetical protein
MKCIACALFGTASSPLAFLQLAGQLGADDPSQPLAAKLRTVARCLCREHLEIACSIHAQAGEALAARRSEMLRIVKGDD